MNSEISLIFLSFQNLRYCEKFKYNDLYLFNPPVIGIEMYYYSIYRGVNDNLNV